MSRMKNNEGQRKITKVKNLITILLLIYIIAAPLAYGYFMDKENDRIIDFIKNYDSDKKVFYLKKDLLGGN